MPKANAGPATLPLFERPEDYFGGLGPPVTPIARTWRRACVRNVTPQHLRAAHVKTHTPPRAMFRDLRVPAPSILAGIWIGPIRRRANASLVMTQCVLPSHHTRKKLQVDLNRIKSNTK